jgi:hypothetical protein
MVFNASFNPVDNKIDVVYAKDELGRLTGTAYFRRDDMCALIVDGDFSHPYYGTQYRIRIIMGDCLLEVLRWSLVDCRKPVATAATAATAPNAFV